MYKTLLILNRLGFGESMFLNRKDGNVLFFAASNNLLNFIPDTSICLTGCVLFCTKVIFQRSHFYLINSKILSYVLQFKNVLFKLKICRLIFTISILFLYSFFFHHAQRSSDIWVSQGDSCAEKGQMKIKMSTVNENAYFKINIRHLSSSSSSNTNIL